MKKQTFLLIGFMGLILTLALLFVPSQTSAEYSQDRKMRLIRCYCGNGQYGYAFSCYQWGDECYQSYYCFCD